MNKGCILTNIALSSENSHFFVKPPFEIGWFGSHLSQFAQESTPQKTNAANALKNGKNDGTGRRFFAL